MKKLLTVLCGVVIALSLFATTGNTVKAAAPTTAPISAAVEHEDDCACHDVTTIVGVEKVKIIAKIILSEEFLKANRTLGKMGYTWNITKNIEVIKQNQSGEIMVGISFTNKKGSELIAVFIDGIFVGSSPR
jgi:hypothetical protein